MDDVQILKLVMGYVGSGAGGLLLIIYASKKLGMWEWIENIMVARAARLADVESLRQRAETENEDRHRRQVDQVTKMFEGFLATMRDECQREIANLRQDHEEQRKFTARLLEKVLQERQNGVKP